MPTLPTACARRAGNELMRLMLAPRARDIVAISTLSHGTMVEFTISGTRRGRYNGKYMPAHRR